MHLNQDNVQVTFKSCATFTNCIPDTLNTRVERLKTEGNCEEVVFELQIFHLGLD